MSKKLRNKKTGDVGDLLGSCDSVPFIGIMVDYHDGNPVRYEYDSLAKLNEEWEDYESKEPLIKNEKIRRAVRAWAEANGIERVWHEYFLMLAPWKRSSDSDGKRGYRTWTR